MSQTMGAYKDARVQADVWNAEILLYADVKRTFEWK